MLVILASSCLCHAMSFARSLLQLLALPSITQGLRFSHRGNAVKLCSCSAVQSDLFAGGQKNMDLSDRSLCCQAQAKSNRSLPEHFQPAKRPSSQLRHMNVQGSSSPPGTLKLLQNTAVLLASIIPPSTSAVWVLSSPPQLSKVRSTKICSTNRLKQGWELEVLDFSFLRPSYGYLPEKYNLKIGTGPHSSWVVYSDILLIAAQILGTTKVALWWRHRGAGSGWGSIKLSSNKGPCAWLGCSNRKRVTTKLIFSTKSECYPTCSHINTQQNLQINHRGWKLVSTEAASRWMTSPQMQREGRKFAARGSLQMPGSRAMNVCLCQPVPGGMAARAPAVRLHSRAPRGMAWPPSWASEMGCFVPGELGSTRSPLVLWQWQWHEIADTSFAVWVKQRSYLVVRCLRRKNVKHTDHAEQSHWPGSQGCWRGQAGSAATVTWELLDIAALR